MRARFIAIAALWITAAILSVYAALALHSSLLPIIGFLLATCGTLVLRPRLSVGILRVVPETAEDKLVESSLGFSVRMSNSSIIYREGACCITILPCGGPGKPVAFKIAPNIPLVWDASAGNVPLTGKQQQEIRHRIIRAISFLPSAQLSRKQRHALQKKSQETGVTPETPPPRE